MQPISTTETAQLYMNEIPGPAGGEIAKVLWFVDRGLIVQQNEIYFSERSTINFGTEMKMTAEEIKIPSEDYEKAVGVATLNAVIKIDQHKLIGEVFNTTINAKQEGGVQAFVYVVEGDMRDYKYREVSIPSRNLCFSEYGHVVNGRIGSGNAVTQEVEIALSERTVKKIDDLLQSKKTVFLTQKVVIKDFEKKGYFNFKVKEAVKGAAVEGLSIIPQFSNCTLM